MGSATSASKLAPIYRPHDVDWLRRTLRTTHDSRQRNFS